MTRAWYNEKPRPCVRHLKTCFLPQRFFLASTHPICLSHIIVRTILFVTTKALLHNLVLCFLVLKLGLSWEEAIQLVLVKCATVKWLSRWELPTKLRVSTLTGHKGSLWCHLYQKSRTLCVTLYNGRYCQKQNTSAKKRYLDQIYDLAFMTNNFDNTLPFNHFTLDRKQYLS